MKYEILNVNLYFKHSGTICLNSLLQLIKTNNYPMKCAVSVDATACIQKREYHPRYNSILGGILPLEKTGLPDPKGGVVNSVADVMQYFKQNPPAKVVFVIMAQPLADFSPPVRIGTFASDNRMTTADVKNRNDYIKECLNKAGIEIVANGSDGDTREMKCMLQNAGLGISITHYSKDTDEYLFFKKCSGLFVSFIKLSGFDFQDVPHIITKLRNKLLKNHIIALGDYVATPNDLQVLVDRKTKEKTLIRKGCCILKLFFECLFFMLIF